MKKFTFLLFFLCAFTHAQNVYITDHQFKDRLIQANTGNNTAKDINGNSMVIDTNGDGEIQYSEALAVYQLNVSNSNIVNLTGIDAFTNLTSLLCFNNSIISIDVRWLPNLTFINCSHNNLHSLDVAGLANLTSLHCNNNSLTYLDITGLTSLIELHYDYNHLASLDVTGLVNLISLSCRGNNIYDLDVSSMSNLSVLNCSDNNLNEIDLSTLANLNVLDCAYNSLTELDLSNNPFLGIFNVLGNPISYLNIKNGQGFVNSDMQFNFVANLPNNLYICANNVDIPLIQPYLNLNNKTNQVVTSYCTFNPGGNYNTIQGTVSYDVDNNGDCSNDNYQLSHIKVVIDDGTDTGVSYTNLSGEYVFYTQDGNYTITPELENPTYFDRMPASVTVNFPLVNNSVEIEDFCISANGIQPDLEITIAPITPARPGFEADYLIVYKNIGNQIMSQTNGITLSFDDNYMGFVSASETPGTQTAGSLSWDYSNLKPFETRSILVTLLVNPPTDPNFPVNIDDIFTFVAEIAPTTGDANPVDNIFTLSQTVVGAFDPNDITCLQGDIVDPDNIGEELHYLVRFENEGNFAAENVLVEMNINPSHYQVNSMRILGSSHDLESQITGNLAEFFFEDIQLPPNGHGHILIAIKTNNNLTKGDSVLLNADIFFDFNFPITTNDAITEFNILSVQNFDKVIVALYPNPTTGLVNITSDVLIETVEWYDVKGRLLAVETINAKQSNLDLSQLPAGLYIAKIRSRDGFSAKKVVKR